MSEVQLAWTVSDLTAASERCMVLPLTAEAYVGARQRELPILGIDEVLAAEVTAEVTGRRLLNELHAELRKSPTFWLEAYANVAFGLQVFQFASWLQLLRGLRELYGPATLIRLPDVFLTKVLHVDTFIYGLAQESLRLACRVVAREGGNINRLNEFDPRSRRRHAYWLAGFFASFLTPLVSWFWLRPRRVDSSSASTNQTTDVLLVTQQYGDAFHATPFARRLANRYGNAFRWLGIRPIQTPDLTTEEASLITSESLDDLNFTDTSSISILKNEHCLGWTILDAGAAWTVASELVSRNALGVQRTDWFDLLRGKQFHGFASKANRWSKLLGVSRPKIIVGLSSLQDMALVRAWARRRRVPYVCLMHGVFPALHRSHDVDADYLGVFGDFLLRSLVDPALVRPKHIAVCGTMQFGDKARSGLGLLLNIHHPREDVLFLASFETLPFMPQSPEAQFQLISEIHRACVENGRLLRLRTHPRYPKSAWLPYVERISDEFPGTITFSTEPSITRDLSTCIFAVANIMDGAFMDALLAGLPVLSYLPTNRRSTEQSLLLRETGGLIQGKEELREILGIVYGDERWSKMLGAQRAFLARYFKDPHSDPWDGAMALTEHALKSARSDCLHIDRPLADRNY